MSYPLLHPDSPAQPPLWLSVDEFRSAFPGENDYVELKHGVSGQRVQEAAVAFSNADGGVYIVGVAANGEIDGVPQPGESAKLVHQAMRDARNPGRYDVRELGVGDKSVLVLTIARRHEGFAQTSGGAVLMRKGASNAALLGDELSRFLSRRSFNASRQRRQPSTSMPLIPRCWARWPPPMAGPTTSATVPID